MTHPSIPPGLSSKRSGRKELRLPQNRTKRIATKAKSAREPSPSYRLIQKLINSGPIWAHMGPILFRKSLILIENHKTINKNVEVVKLEIL